MKYYPKTIFWILITIHLLALPIVLVFGKLFFFWITYQKPEDFFVVWSALFIIFSGIILLLQQFKNKYWGYIMLFLAPISFYAINYVLSSEMFTWSGVQYFLTELLWVTILLSPIFLVSIIPFYVLIKLVREDLFKKRRIVQ